jgi:hypothetical protein
LACGVFHIHCFATTCISSEPAGADRLERSAEAAHQNRNTNTNSVAEVQPISNSRLTISGSGPRLAPDPHRYRTAKTTLHETTRSARPASSRPGNSRAAGWSHRHSATIRPKCARGEGQLVIGHRPWRLAPWRESDFPVELAPPMRR